jgi:hypothetical protein
MNAIQYFDWGDFYRPFSTLRVKSFFLLPIGEKLFNSMREEKPFRPLPFRYSVSHGDNVGEYQFFDVRHYMYKEENDLVIKTLCNREIGGLLTLPLRLFQLFSNSLIFAESPKKVIVGNFYINGRKIGATTAPYYNSSMTFHYGMVLLNMLAFPKFIVYEDNQEPFLFSHIVGKELILDPTEYYIEYQKYSL